MPSTPQRRAQRRNEIRDKVRRIKEERKCKECGESDPEKLLFHHRPGQEHKFWIHEGLRDRKSEKQIMAEIEKCDVLCFRCHRRWHYENSKAGQLTTELMGILKGKRSA